MCENNVIIAGSHVIESTTYERNGTAKIQPNDCVTEG